MFFVRKFPDYLDKCEIVGCSDQYQRESSVLFNRIEYWCNKRGL